MPWACPCSCFGFHIWILIETFMNTLYSDIRGWGVESPVEALPEIHKMWGSRGAPEHLQGLCRPKTNAGEQKWSNENNQYKPISEPNPSSQLLLASVSLSPTLRRVGAAYKVKYWIRLKSMNSLSIETKRGWEAYLIKAGQYMFIKSKRCALSRLHLDFYKSIP